MFKIFDILYLNYFVYDVNSVEQCKRSKYIFFSVFPFIEDLWTTLIIYSSFEKLSDLIVHEGFWIKNF